MTDKIKQIENARSPEFLDRLRYRSRREFLGILALSAGATPLLAKSQAQRPRTYPPQYSDKVMGPVSVHEVQDVARRNLDHATYNYITGGAEDEWTLRANVEAYRRVWLRRRVMIDVSAIDTSLDLLGHKLEFPILLDPTTKNRIVPEGDKLAAMGAHASKAIYCVSSPLSWIDNLYQAEQAPVWWASTLGHSTKSTAQGWARRHEEAGATALAVTVDHPYSPNRDRIIRNHWSQQRGGELHPTRPSLTWQHLDWLRSASDLPLIIKGVLTSEDAALAVDNGAQAVIVSNHGGRALDGAVPTLMALPEVVDAVDGKIPVLIDGGMRRGTDILKALALGAKAVLIGRPYVWGLAAFGQVGVQRVVEMLRAELVVSMGLAGMPNLGSINRSLVRLPWEQ
jgi:4-hydroxymandelate oxidase